MARRTPACVGRNGPIRPRLLEEIVRLPRRSPAHEELQRTLAAASRLHVVWTNLEPVPVRVTTTTSEAGAYRFRNREPVDLRVSRLGGRLALGFLHELAHLLDHQLDWGSDKHPAFAAWRTQVARLERRSIESARRRRYFHSPREVWARTYAQTVLAHSCDDVLLAKLDELHRADDDHLWPEDVFAPVAASVELTLERLGWTQLPLPLAA
jgi:hypothetical protein